MPNAKVARNFKSQSWTPIYMIIVIIIAVILLLTFVKPLFNQAQGASQQGLDSAQQALKSIAIALS
ncbi:TPA: hypothetical protein HA244_05760 [Candidatus Micrarchaeota archaeon]|nr:hypothetical protein [Candidatus Micrarchaeota archaeon]